MDHLQRFASDDLSRRAGALEEGDPARLVVDEKVRGTCYIGLDGERIGPDRVTPTWAEDRLDYEMSAWQRRWLERYFQGTIG